MMTFAGRGILGLLIPLALVATASAGLLSVTNNNSLDPNDVYELVPNGMIEGALVNIDRTHEFADLPAAGRQVVGHHGAEDGAERRADQLEELFQVPGGAGVNDSRPEQPAVSPLEEELPVPEGQDELMSVMATLMPWVISLFFHAGILVILAFIMIVTSRKMLKADVVVPEIPISENLGGRINPGEIRIRTRLRSDLARVLLANSITLTPGTVTVDIEDDYLYIHWLSTKTTNVIYAGEIIKGHFELWLGRIFR